jgi:phage-related protein
MKSLVSILVVFVLLALPLGQINTRASSESAPPAYSGYPTFSISKVVKNTSVTIKTNNLPPNDSFKVRMGKMGTKAVGGIVVGSFDSGSGGTKSFTFDIPADLKGLKQIAIRFDSTTGSGYFAYNWFWNNGSSSGGAGTGGYGGYPTFTITAVVRNSSVTIKAYNLPKNDTFAVRMNKMGTKGSGGIKVDTFSSGSGGTKTFTFTIPDELKGLKQIAIRFDSTTGSGFFAYNWFYNTTTK